MLLVQSRTAEKTFYPAIAHLYTSEHCVTCCLPEDLGIKEMRGRADFHKKKEAMEE